MLYVQPVPLTNGSILQSFGCQVFTMSQNLQDHDLNAYKDTAVKAAQAAGEVTVWSTSERIIWMTNVSWSKERSKERKLWNLKILEI